MPKKKVTPLMLGPGQLEQKLEQGKKEKQVQQISLPVQSRK